MLIVINKNLFQLIGLEPMFLFLFLGLLKSANLEFSKGCSVWIQNKIKQDFFFAMLLIYFVKTLSGVVLTGELSDFLNESNDKQLNFFSTNIFFEKMNLFLAFLFIAKNILQKNSFQCYKHKNIDTLLSLLAFLTICFFFKAYSFIYMFFCFLAINFYIYALVFFNKQANLKHETTTKYFYMSTLSACLLGYSIWLIFDLFVNLNMLQISCLIHKLSDFIFFNKNLFLFFIIFSISFFFKLAVFPCHFWTPEIYKFSSQNLVFFLSIPVKFVFFFVLIKIIKNVFFLMLDTYAPIFLLSSLISLFLGAFGAVYENTWKSFFAYTSINQIGFVALTIIFTNFSSEASFIYFFLIYVISSTIFFFGIGKIGLYTKKKQLLFMDQMYCVLNKKEYHSYILCFSMLSFAGIPIFGGFYSKYLIFSDIFYNEKTTVLILILSLNLLSSFYYISIIKKIIFEKKVKVLNCVIEKPIFFFHVLSVLLILWSFFHQSVFYFFEKETETLFF